MKLAFAVNQPARIGLSGGQDGPDNSAEPSDSLCVFRPRSGPHHNGAAFGISMPYCRRPAWRGGGAGRAAGATSTASANAAVPPVGAGPAEARSQPRGLPAPRSTDADAFGVMRMRTARRRSVRVTSPASSVVGYRSHRWLRAVIDGGQVADPRAPPGRWWPTVWRAAGSGICVARQLSRATTANSRSQAR